MMFEVMKSRSRSKASKLMQVHLELPWRGFATDLSLCSMHAWS